MLSLNPTFVDLDAPATRNLLDLARSGNAAAFGDICRAYETRLLRQAMTLCGNETTAKELAEDTLVEAWKCLRRYNGRCEFFTWLCAILLNRHRHAFRRQRPRSLAMLGGREREEFENLISRLPDQEPLPDQAAQLREQAVLIWQCVQSLPARQQQVVYLRFYVDHSLEGIAAALDCSLGTAKSRLYHALERLRGMPELAALFFNLDAP